MHLPVIFPSTALRNNQAAVREAVANHPVYITDSGNQDYVFCTEEQFNAEERKAEEEAAYAARVSRLIERGKANIAAGRCINGLDAARDYVNKARISHG